VAHLGTFLVQKQQAALILQSQRNLDALFNTIHDMVFILDMEARILHLNATALARLGYAPPELIGQSVLKIHPSRLHQQAMDICAAMIAGKQNFCPLPLVSKQGVEIPVETNLTFGQWSGNKVIFGLSRDIGERLQLEHQQRLLLKNEGMERMAGAIAHHFNNLMAIVAGNVELAREETNRSTDAYLFLNNALDGSKRAIELGKSLLIYTGHFAEETESLDLVVLCRHHLGELAASLPANIRLTEEYPQSGPIVLANPQQFDRVLSALMSNSVEGIGQNSGQISVRISSVGAGQISAAHLFPAGWKPDHERYGRLEIADTGGGIDDQQMVSIFDPFYSEKFIGRGLGLPLALSIVKKLGGAIIVQSQPNKGSVFQVLLPEATSPTPAGSNKEFFS
jgi:PAS domain S-box-containing protein